MSRRLELVVALGTAALLRGSSARAASCVENDCCQAFSSVAFSGPPSSCKDRRRVPGAEPIINGCGPNGFVGYVIKLYNSFAGADFEPSCNNHDACYQDCTKDKQTCDNLFQFDMKTACNRALPGKINIDDRNWCLGIAKTNWLAVTNPLAQGAYDFDQQLNCRCCEACGTTCGGQCCDPGTCCTSLEGVPQCGQKCGTRECCNSTQTCCPYLNGTQACEAPTGDMCGVCHFKCGGDCCDKASYNTCCVSSKDVYSCGADGCP